MSVHSQITNNTAMLEPTAGRCLARYPAIQTLLAFETAARLGSFSRAAESLFLSQSAVTYQIKALESYLDTRLFDRKGRGVKLTPAGEAIHADITMGLQVIGRSLSGVRRQAPGCLTGTPLQRC